MVDKKAVAIVSIIALIIVGVILGIRVKNLNNYKYQEPKETEVAQNSSGSGAQENKNESTNSSKENVSENNTSDNEVSENGLEKEKSKDSSDTENTTNNTSSVNTTEENETKENNSTKNTSSNTATNNNTSKTNSTEKDPEKLDISLAKEIWGKKNSNVYFDVEDKNEKKGIYTIVVRDSSTTVEMTTYKVDINKKTVTE